MLKTDSLEIGTKNIYVQLKENIAEEFITFINTGKVEQINLNYSIFSVYTHHFTFANCTKLDIFLWTNTRRLIMELL